MAEQLNSYLPRLEHVSMHTWHVAEAVQSVLLRAPHSHECAAIAEVVANAVLDGRTPGQAMAFAMNYSGGRAFSEVDGDDAHYAELGAELRMPAVTVLLAGAREAATRSRAPSSRTSTRPRSNS
ncbi:hypothetical protein [Trinickia symbiotica]|nr:hypothetical protein [Trinickia symbiotica]